MLQLVQADVSERNFLISLAIASHDTHGTRQASDAVAREVLDIKEEQYDGNVCKLLDDEILMGFFALAQPAINSDSSSPQNTFELTHFFISPDYIRCGYGKKMFDELLTLLNKRKQCASLPSRIHFISDPDSIGFYIRLGAAVIGYDENLLNPGVSVAIMEYILGH